MQYKIVNLRVKNFKCFDNAQFYEFRIEYEKNPIILSGPNGFGKTTFFDAIELIFSKNITRLDKGIEKKTTNLGKNILLNKANEDGYVVLTLRNEQSDCLTIFAKILNNVDLPTLGLPTMATIGLPTPLTSLSKNLCLPGNLPPDGNSA